MTALHEEFGDDIEALLSVLPPQIYAAVRRSQRVNNMLEIVMDLGREPEARLANNEELVLSNRPVSFEDIEYVIARIGAFGEDNRAGIERTLHRISCIRNRSGLIIGLTLRVGRAVYGTIAIIQDIVESGKSILLLGRPGVGKTTMLREVARVLADDFKKRVIIVDTSNEIGGDGDIPHPAVGRARRMQVASPAGQHAVMIEAVENHMPQVIVIDEIGTELEAAAARTIAERGVQLVGTAHGNELENLMQNPTLSDLIGGIQAVTLGDEEARRRGTQKTVLERKAPPTFDVVVEIQNWSHVVVHQDVAETIDSMLRNYPMPGEIRTRDDEGTVHVEEAPPDRPMHAFGPGVGPAPAARSTNGAAVPAAALASRANGVLHPVRIFPFGVGRNRLEQAAREMRVPVTVARTVQDADLVLTLKNYYRRKPEQLRVAEAMGTRVHVLKSNTVAYIQQALGGVFDIGVREARETKQRDPTTEALLEAEQAIGQVLDHSRTIELAPQNAHIRRLQHQLAEQHNVGSRSRGKEPHRRVKFFPREYDEFVM